VSGKDPAAVSLGRRGGSATSPAKAEAARANGAKGGRPRVRWALVEQIQPDDLAAIDLRAHVEDEPGAECWRLIGPGGQRGDLVYYDAGRAGIATGADAQWTDCASAADAVRRLNDGELVR
jgi:hypothetical protein